MLEYRRYALDAAGLISGPSHDFECAHDEEARQHALDHLHEGRDADIEIWRGTLRVFPPG